mgnify:FL=1
MDNLAQQAISEALSGNWPLATELNELILKAAPEDTDALIRLARAQIELGQYPKAKKNLDLATRLDPLNSIANKLLARLKRPIKSDASQHTKIDPEIFLEEPGKTKLTELTHLGDKDAIFQLHPGDEVNLNTGGHTISVNTLNSRHIGRIHDSLGFRLKKLVSEGFTFRAYIKSADPDSVKIFIREVDKPEKLSSVLSFPIERIEKDENLIPSSEPDSNS